ncbi:MAG: hypothetical protein ACRDMZ_03820, partial [Solirubrobacteraceae bacterium]
MAIDTTGQLLRELDDIDAREDSLLDSLLRRLADAEAVAQRDRGVTAGDLQSLKLAIEELQARIAKAQSAPVSPSVDELAKQIKDHDAVGDDLRELLTARLQALTPVGTAAVAAAPA